VGAIVRRERSGRCPGTSGGLVLIALLVFVFLASFAAMVAAESWTLALQREREAELLFIGGEFRDAIRAYYFASPGAQRYPRRLDELLEDERFPSVRRHLRRVYRDPMTGKRDWVLIEAPGGGIMGVHSRSREGALKTANFSDANRDLEGKASYADWKFVFQPAPVTASPAPRP
jgi:type II secretory pathway pseudopilin PulG